MARLHVTVLGAGGFVGKALSEALSAMGHLVDAVTRRDLDLADPGAGEAIAQRLTVANAVVLAACVTPDVARRTGSDPTERNLAMATHLADCAAAMPGLHVIYLSSDAVYGVRSATFDEETQLSPEDDYGRMHAKRERLLAEACPGRVAILRLSQVYGPGDTHNAYGPCRFARQALASEPIALFGQGEDARDHIWIDDVTAAISRVLETRYVGPLCVSAGASPPFLRLADLIAAQVPGAWIEFRPRCIPAAIKRLDNRRLRELGIEPRSVEEGVPLLVARFGAEQADT